MGGRSRPGVRATLPTRAYGLHEEVHMVRVIAHEKQARTEGKGQQDERPTWQSSESLSNSQRIVTEYWERLAKEEVEHADSGVAAVLREWENPGAITETLMVML